MCKLFSSSSLVSNTQTYSIIHNCGTVIQFQNTESVDTCKFKAIRVSWNQALCFFPGKTDMADRTTSDRSFITVLHEQLSPKLPKVAKLEKTRFWMLFYELLNTCAGSLYVCHSL